MEDSDIRNQLLAELIDKMQMRMADKMYPDDTHGDMEAKSAEEMPEKMEKPEMEMAVMSEDEPSDDELSALMKEAE